MTTEVEVFGLFYKRYLEWLKRIERREWENIKANATAKKMPIPDYMLRSIELEVNPRDTPDVYAAIIQMNKDKLIASNRHRQEHGHIDRFWLTAKGLSKFKKLECTK